MPLVQQRSVGPLVHLDSAIVRLAVHEGLALAFPTPSATLARRVPQTITETITTDVAPSTAVSPSAQSTTSIPVSAIAGGAVAGAVVAVLLAILWKMYSRCSRRNRENYRMRFGDGVEIRVDTRRHSSSFTRPPVRSPKNGFKRVQLQDPKSIEENLPFDDEKDSLPFLERTPVPSVPRPLRPVVTSPKKTFPRARTLSTPGPPSRSNQPRPTAAPEPPAYCSNPNLLTIPQPVVTSPPPSPARRVEWLADELDAPVPQTLLPQDTASGSDSVSFYSVQSGETRRPPVAGRSLLAATVGMGGNARTSIITKDSVSIYSEAESFSNWRRGGPGLLGRSRSKPNRLSSNSSALPPILSSVPIGLAVSGEEDEEPMEY